MNKSFLERFCALALSLQFVFFLLSVNVVVNKWDFPAVAFLLAAAILGCFGAVLGIGHAIKSKNDMKPGRPDALVIYLFCILTVVSIEFIYGWNNLDLSAANDYSTDAMNPPQFNQSKNERLLVKEPSKLLSFMNIPHKIRKAGTDSIVLPLSGFDSKILVKQALNKLGWMLVQRFDDVSNHNGFNETYTVIGGVTGIRVFTDVAVRVRSNNLGVSVIDIRASSNNSRRDMGFNERVIKELAETLRGLEAL
jgi:hypothetical protein